MNEERFGDLLSPASDPTPIEPEVEYQTAGILSHGKGLFARPIRKGSEISYSTYYRLRAGQLVFSRLFAWEGALAVVPEEFDGFFVSQEFPTFDIDSTKALPSFVALVINRPGLWDRLAEVVTGMGGRRKRVHPSALFGIAVPVPPLAEQRRIVDLLASVDAAREATSNEARAAQVAREAWLETAVSAQLGPLRAIGDLAEINPETTAGFAADSSIRYIDLASIRPGRGIDQACVRTLPFSTAPSRARRTVRQGDVLVSTVRPYLRGHAPVPRVLDGAVASTGFAVLRTRPDECRADYLWAAVSGTSFSRRLSTFATGSSYPAVTAADVAAIEIACPPVSVQQRIASVVTAFDDVIEQASDAGQRIVTVRSTLLTQLLSGSHEIPASYDRFLDGAA